MDEDSKPRILAIIALDEEYSAFLEEFPDKKDLSTATQLRFEHETGEDQVRLFSVLSNKMGAKSAGFSAEETIKLLKPQAVVVIGIAGGLSNDVKLGDVCVSNEIIDVLHNNKFVDGPNGQGESNVRFAPDFYAVNAEYLSSFTFLKIHPKLKEKYVQWQETAKGNALSLDITLDADAEYNLVLGPVVCGPVSASKKFNDTLKNINRKCIALETESGGVFSWCDKFHVPVVALRGISDMADAHKNNLETSYSGNYRKLAMKNAIDLLKCQLGNDRFINFLKKKLQR